jgi:mono/diheme cytochrome c family protein
MGRGVLIMKAKKVVLGIVVVLLATACASGSVQERGMQDMAADGATLWRETCSHCHNLRSAQEFTAQQWPIIVSHMRTRADLSKSEAEAIAAYLMRLSD